ncbi:10322_t:CDS:1, partial [Racocetra persica]
KEMSFEKYSFNIIQTSDSFFSTSTNTAITHQDLLTYISSLQDTIAAVASSSNRLEKKTKEYSSGSSCKKYALLRIKLNDTYTELKKRKSQKEMLQKIKDLKKHVIDLEKENLCH